MSKNHQRNKTNSNNRGSASTTIDPETMEGAGHSPSKSVDGAAPSYEEIQARAYQIHEQKGGSELENWLEAEKVLKEEQRMQKQ